MISDLTSLSPGRSKAAIAAALVLSFAFAASVMLGPQLALWPSGPALVLLAVACVLVLRSPARLPRSVAWSGIALVTWLSARCLTSPVVEFALADGILLVSCVAVFWVSRAVMAVRNGTEILFTVLGLLVFANWWPMWMQAKDSTYVLWLPRGTETFPSGFFGYYGDCAAFLTGMALLSGGLAWDARRRPWFRILMVLVALAAAAGVTFTRARGGMIGLGAGGFLLLVLAPWLTMDRGSRGRGVLALVLPLALIGGILWIVDGLQEAQRVRGITGTGDLLDNSARLFWLQLAASSIALHPWQGGGSRSFSWENLRFWDGDWSKFSDAEPEFAHNEWMQIANDYGIIGLLLVVLFFGTVVVAGIVGRWNDRESKANTATLLAGVAALAGLLVHASFHFVFHIPPLALLLGLTLATILETTRQDGPAAATRRGGFAALLPAGCALFLGGIGVMAIRTFDEMAPLRYRFGQGTPTPADVIDRAGRAARIWPGHELPLLRGKLLQASAAAASGVDRQLLLESSESAFRESRRRHPFDPDSAVGLANVLGALEQDQEAEREFERAIHLQGGAERSFQARFWASYHFWRKAERQRAAGDTDGALATLFQARDLFDQDASPTLWEYGSEARVYRLALSRHLGTWLEGLRRHQEAAEEYDRAVQFPGGQGIHFLAARNLTAWGEALWQKRQPSEALGKFTEARSRVNQAAGIPPTGHTVTEIVDLAHLLDAKIAFLKGAGIELED